MNYISGETPGRSGVTMAPTQMVTRNEPLGGHAGPARPEVPLVDLPRLKSALRRNIWVIVGAVAVALILGAIATALTTPIYRSEARLQIERQSARVLDVEGVQPEAAIQEANQILETQVQILQSRSLLQRTALRAGFFNDNRFLDAMKVAPPPAELNMEAQRAARRELVVDAMRENLTVALVPNTQVVSARFDSPNPALAAQVVNAMVQEYLAGNLQRRLSTTGYARGYLREQLAEAKGRLEASERALNAYARQANLVSDDSAAQAIGGQSTRSSLTASSLAQLNAARNNARTARIQAEQRWQLASGAPSLSLPGVLGNSAIMNLVARRAELRSQLEQQRVNRKSDHPDVTRAAAEIEELEQQINSLVTNVRQSIRNDYQSALQQEQALNRDVASLTGQSLNEQDRGVQYNVLSREVQTNRTLYDGLLQRFNEVSAAAGAETDNISVIDIGERAKDPIKPRPLLNLVLAGFGGLAIGLLAAIARERLTDRLRFPDDIGARTGLPLLASIPKSDEALSPSAATPGSAVAEAYSSLRIALEHSTQAGIPKVLLFTSSQPGEGKTTSAIFIARELAASGRRTLLIDGDLRRPSLHRTLALSNEQGLSGVLSGRNEVGSAIQAVPNTPNLSVIPSGPIPPNPTLLLSGSGITKVVQAVSPYFDAVVIDGPPVLGLADAPILGSQAEGTIFVVEAGRSNSAQIRAVLARLSAANVVPLGVVFTKFDAKSMGYDSNYAYYYEYRADRS